MRQSITGFSCTCSGYIEQFCYSADSSDFIALVELIKFTDHSAATFGLVENINKEIPDTIEVLGQDGFNCNINLDQFSIGDTLLINTIYYVDSLQNAYNLKYYRWGIETCSRNYLHFSDNKVIGELGTIIDSTESDYNTFKENLFECFDFTLSSKRIYEPKLKIYPNPFKNELWIEIPDVEILGVKLYSLEGKQLRDLSIQSSSINRIAFSNEGSGYYFIEINTSEGILRRKLLKIN